MNSKDRKRSWLVGALGAAVGLALFGVGAFERLDLLVLDGLERSLLPEVASQVVIVEIDADACADFGWPLPKPVLEVALRALGEAGARRVGLDVILVDREHRLGDREAKAAAGDEAALSEEKSLAEAAQRAKAVFASSRVRPLEPPKKALPATPFSSALSCPGRVSQAFVLPLVEGLGATRVGLVDVQPSSDGTFRSGFGCLCAHDGCAVSLSSALADEDPACERCDVPQLVPFLRPFSGFSRLSLSALVDSLRAPEGLEALKKKVGGKVALIAYTDETLADFGPTPRASREPLVAVHANRVDALLAGVRLASPPAAWPLLASLLALAGLLALARRARGLLGGAAASVVLGGGASALAFSLSRAWLPPSALVLPALSGTLAAGALAAWRQFRFNEMLHDAFRDYVAPEVLDWLKQTGGAALSPEAATTRQITVLFSDIAGYTRLSNALAPTQIMDSLRFYLGEMVAVVQKHGGYIDKINGDGLMVLFGAPRADERHADLAVACAKAMQARVLQLRPRWKELTGGELTIRIGVATGPAFVGNLGGKGHIEYTAIGRDVNLAARLESKSVHGGVLVSEGTYAAMAAKPVGEFRDLELKGYEDGKVKAFQIPPPGSLPSK